MFKIQSIGWKWTKFLYWINYKILKVKDPLNGINSMQLAHEMIKLGHSYKNYKKACKLTHRCCLPKEIYDLEKSNIIEGIH